MKIYRLNFSHDSNGKPGEALCALACAGLVMNSGTNAEWKTNDELQKIIEKIKLKN